MWNSVEAILFPDVCLCCGVRKSDNYVCDYCLTYRFKRANPQFERAAGDSLLPDSIIFQHALWQFDKQGVLQYLLHQLKYNHLRGIGVRLGNRLGQTLLNSPFFKETISNEVVNLLPVPLHVSKIKRRGFNQARAIAEGIHQTAGVSLISDETVVRSKKTSTQTGFSMKKRLANMNGAFEVVSGANLEGKHLLIVDDVFTTGATTFELARTLDKYEISGLSIATVALT